MDLFNALLAHLDALLILPFRLPPDPVAGFWLGAALLALVCSVLGEYSMALAFAFNHRHYREQNAAMTHMHNLSIRAIQAKDKASYLAANRLANEHFGKVFFSSAALFATSLWPAPLALAWLSTRFSGVDIPLPLTGLALGYTGVFLLAYIASRVLTARLRRRLPLLDALRRRALAQGGEMEEMLSWSDMLAPQSAPSQAHGDQA